MTKIKSFIEFLIPFQLHASYQYQGESSFKECRTLQAYQMIQYMKHCTRTDDAVIMLGDFNHEPHELGLLAIKQLTPFRDTYDIAKDKVKFATSLIMVIIWFSL